MRINLSIYLSIYLELFENDFKGGSSGCPGALRTRVNEASGYLDMFPWRKLRMRSAASLDNFKNFCLLFPCPMTAQCDLELFGIASSLLKAISHALTGTTCSGSPPSYTVIYSITQKPILSFSVHKTTFFADPDMSKVNKKIKPTKIHKKKRKEEFRAWPKKKTFGVFLLRVCRV